MPVFLDYMKAVIPWEDHGFELVCEAKDGREALASALECKPDIVLTDINMPYLDGFEFVQSLKHHLPACSVVFITGHTEFDYARKALKLGAVDYLVKPFEEDELLITLLGLQRYHQAVATSHQQVKNALYLREESLLRALVLGNVVPEMTDYDDMNIGQTMGKATGFRVAVFSIATSGTLASDQGLMSDLRAHWRVSLTRILENAVDEGLARFSFTDYDDHLVVLICYDQDLASEYYDDDFEQLVAHIDDKLNMQVTMGLSDMTRDLAGIRKAYLGALSRLEQKNLVAGRDIAPLDHKALKQQRITQAIIDYLHGHFTNPDLAMADVEKALLINQTDLRSVFKSRMGMTITDYILKIRMEKAYELIEKGQHKLAYVAELVGYVDAGYFSRCYKKYFGYAPIQTPTQK